MSSACKISEENGDMACNRLVALETKVCMMDRLTTQRFEAAELALTLSREGMDHRLTLLNELRSGVLTKDEYLQAHKLIEVKIDSLSAFQSRMIGVGLVIVVVVGILGAVLGHLWK